MSIHQSELHRQQEAWKAARARLFNSKPKTVQRSPEHRMEPNQASAKSSRRKMKLPLWRVEPTNFDSHVRDYREMTARPIVLFIARRACDFGVTYKDLTQKGRLTYRMAQIRDRIAAEYLSQNPNTQWTALARAFNRDHSAIYFGVHGVWAEEGNEASRKKMAVRDERMRRFFASLNEVRA